MYEPKKGEKYLIFCSQEIIGPAVVWPAFWGEGWEWNEYCVSAMSKSQPSKQRHGKNQFSSSSSWILCTQQVRLLILWKVIIDSICPLIMTSWFWKHTLLLRHLHRSLEMISVTSWCVLSLEGAMLKLCSSWGRDFLALLTVPAVSQAAEQFRAVKKSMDIFFFLTLSRIIKCSFQKEFLAEQGNDYGLYHSFQISWDQSLSLLLSWEMPFLFPLLSCKLVLKWW